MKNREAQALFKESEILYRERRYDEALDVLQRLDTRYPNTRNILYPIAKSLRRLSRIDEAAAICDRLIREFDDKRAKHLRKNLERAIKRAAAQTIQVTADFQLDLDDEIDAGFDALDLGDLPPLDEEAPTVHLPGGYPAKRVQESNIPWMYIGIGTAVVVLLAVVVVAAMSGGGSETDVETVAISEPEAIDGVQLFINVFGFIFITSIINYWISLYSTLRISDKLPYGSFSDDALSILGFSVLCFFLGVFIPCIGIIGSIYILRNRYDLVFIDFLVLIGINIGISIPIGIIYTVLFSGAINEWAAAYEATTL